MSSTSPYLSCSPLQLRLKDSLSEPIPLFFRKSADISVARLAFNELDYSWKSGEMWQPAKFEARFVLTRLST